MNSYAPFERKRLVSAAWSSIFIESYRKNAAGWQHIACLASTNTTNNATNTTNNTTNRSCFGASF